MITAIRERTRSSIGDVASPRRASRGCANRGNSERVPSASVQSGIWITCPRMMLHCRSLQMAHSAIRQAPRALVRSWGFSSPISYGFGRVAFRQHVTLNGHQPHATSAAQHLPERPV